MSAVSEVAATVAPVPEIVETAAPVPEAVETAAPVPEAVETAAPVPEAVETAAPVPEAVETAPEEGVAGSELAQQLEFCLSDTYVALSRVLQKNLVKIGKKAMSVPLSVVAGVLPTYNSEAPDLESLQAVVEAIPHMELDAEGTLTYRGRGVPAGNRIGECRRRTVVVDRIASDATRESISKLLAGCGTIVAATICHPRLTASYVKGAFRSSTLHALIQFKTVEDAVCAVESMNFSWRGGPRVTHLMTEFRARSPLRGRPHSPAPLRCANRSPAPLRSRSHSPRPSRMRSPVSDSSSSDSSKDMADGSMAKDKRGAVQDQKGANGDVQTDGNTASKSKKKKEKKKGKAKPDPEGKKSEQGVKKRPAKKDYATWAAASPENRLQPPRFTNSSMSQPAPGVSPVDGIVPRRVVKGPDGTRGFTMGRGRPLAVPTH